MSKLISELVVSINNLRALETDTVHEIFPEGRPEFSLFDSSVES